MESYFLESELQEPVIESLAPTKRAHVRKGYRPMNLNRMSVEDIRHWEEIQEDAEVFQLRERFQGGRLIQEELEAGQ